MAAKKSSSVANKKKLSPPQAKVYRVQPRKRPGNNENERIENNAPIKRYQVDIPYRCDG
jgi:hypothetical protein